MEKTIVFKPIENQTIIWFPETNNYIITNNETAKIIQLIEQKKSFEEISIKLSDKLNIEKENLLPIISDIHKNLYITNTTPLETPPLKTLDDTNQPTTIKRYYKINNTTFKVDFYSKEEEFIIHTKFEHLEINKPEKHNKHFKVTVINNLITLIVDNVKIGSWNKNDIHLFQGKFFMEVIQAIHQKEEEQWMGVFHASAVGNKKSSMLFLGDSGNGKSTSLAILQANGFFCLADDFVPVDIEKKEVYNFPSAISIKKNSVPVLSKMYPELKNKTEYHLEFLNKIVRYLPPNTPENNIQHLPCKGLVFIKYIAESKLEINKISSIEAFQKLIPDSWLSPIKTNVVSFLEWFTKLPCYTLTYSNNDEMVNTVKNLFNDEL